MSGRSGGDTRVLIVDDSVQVRNLVRMMLEKEPGFTVVGEAGDGGQAIQAARDLRPDAVVLDIAMPVLDGVEALPHIQAINPACNIVLFSTEDSTSERITHLLRTNKAEFVAKPRQVRDAADAVSRLQRTLLPRLKQGGGLASAPARVSPGKLTPGSSRRIDAVAIGVSTGGPTALRAVLCPIPATFPVPIFVVQHIDGVFSGHLATQLQIECQLKVVEARYGDKPEAGTVYIAHGGEHMGVRKLNGELAIELHMGPKVNSCRPSVDVLFDSMAEMYGMHQLAVVLTGMGEDGLDGARSIKAAGAPVLVQDEATSVVWGMPGAIAQKGLASEVLALDDISARLQRWVNDSRAPLRGLATAD